jgi:hypothetical protein
LAQNPQLTGSAAGTDVTREASGPAAFRLFVNCLRLSQAADFLGSAADDTSAYRVISPVEQERVGKKIEPSGRCRVRRPLLAGVIAQYFQSPIHTVFHIEIGVLCLAMLAMLAMLKQKNQKLGVGAFRPRLPTVAKEHVGIVLLGIALFGPGITSTSFILSRVKN